MPIMAMHDIKLAKSVLGFEKTLIHGGTHSVHFFDKVLRFIEVHSLCFNGSLKIQGPIWFF